MFSLCSLWLSFDNTKERQGRFYEQIICFHKKKNLIELTKNLETMVLLGSMWMEASGFPLP